MSKSRFFANNAPDALQHVAEIISQKGKGII